MIDENIQKELRDHLTIIAHCVSKENRGMAIKEVIEIVLKKHDLLYLLNYKEQFDLSIDRDIVELVGKNDSAYNLMWTIFKASSSNFRWYADK